MTDAPWLTIVGLGEDGADGLSQASLDALGRAEFILGPQRHLDLLAGSLPGTAEIHPWPVPFADGLGMMEGFRGRQVVVLASGDPFWFGAGRVIAQHLSDNEWSCLPALPVFSQAASRLGWALETTLCLGLHAAPFSRLRPHLATGFKAIVTVRDGAAAGALAAWLTEQGFGETRCHGLQALGGPRARVVSGPAVSFDARDLDHPVCMALDLAGPGKALPWAAGRPDDLFEHDGQITKRPIRALTLSALAPKPGEHLWDIGSGSGSVAIEWLLAHPSLKATAIEVDPDRAARVLRNAHALGQDRLQVITGSAPGALEGLPRPDTVFVGGGLSEDLLSHLHRHLSGQSRLVANAVTLESEALLAGWHGRLGGTLIRIDMATAAPLGRKSGWKSAYPIVQWSVEL